MEEVQEIRKAEAQTKNGRVEESKKNQKQEKMTQRRLEPVP